MTEPLTHEDFDVEDGKLHFKRRGSCAVLIMPKDAQSMQLAKILSSLNIDGLATSYLDITQGKNRDVILLARKTNTPITKVPSLAFFFDGKLKSRYKGDANKSAMYKYFQQKVVEYASKGSSGGKNVDSKTPQFAMAKTGANVPIPSAKASGMVGINVAWRNDK